MFAGRAGGGQGLGLSKRDACCSRRDSCFYLVRQQEARLHKGVYPGLVAVVVELSAVDVEPLLELGEDEASRSFPRLLHTGQPLKARCGEVAAPRFDLVERYEYLAHAPNACSEVGDRLAVGRGGVHAQRERLVSLSALGNPSCCWYIPWFTNRETRMLRNRFGFDSLRSYPTATLFRLLPVPRVKNIV